MAIVTSAERVEELRKAVGLTQDQVAQRSGGKLSRNDANKVESGRNKATSDRIRSGLAEAFGVSRDQMSAYMEGRIDLPGLLAARAGDVAPALPVLRNHPRWPALIAEAKKLRRGLTDADFERIADSPFLFGPLESVDAVLLADIANGVADWAARTGER